MKEFPRIVQVNNLFDFMIEIPVDPTTPDEIWPRPIVRISLTERGAGKRGGIPYKTISLDLQAVNIQGEIVWLNHNQQIAWLPQVDAVFPLDASIRRGMRKMYSLVKAHLQGLGYDVRNGCFGIPDSIKPLGGEFECVSWEKHETDDGLTYEVVPANENE